MAFTLENPSAGTCVDCGEETMCGTDVRNGEYVVVHKSSMCQGFRERFTPTKTRSQVTTAFDETGEYVTPSKQVVENQEPVKTVAEEAPLPETPEE